MCVETRFLFACIYIYIYIYSIHAYTASVYTYVSKYACLPRNKLCIHTYMYVYIHTHTHTHTHTYAGSGYNICRKANCSVSIASEGGQIGTNN